MKKIMYKEKKKSKKDTLRTKYIHKEKLSLKHNIRTQLRDVM